MKSAQIDASKMELNQLRLINYFFASKLTEPKLNWKKGVSMLHLFTLP